METLLEQCNGLYLELDCCHGNNLLCSCGRCWEEDFYERPDSYNCLKKLCYYTINYGPAYASEIYHYLNKSQLLEREFTNITINVLSLGCGFSPDAYALEKYINDNNLDIDFNYTGLDIEERWNEIRENADNKYYEVRDLLDGFSLENYDIIFICKAFSTMRRNSIRRSNNFLNILSRQINMMAEGSYLIFDDVNHVRFGRDTFDRFVRDLFSDCTYYYFPLENAYRGTYYTRIDNIENVFDYPDDLEITPKAYVFKTIIFEYRK